MGVLILIERRGSSDSLLRGRSKALVVMRLSDSLFLERRSFLFPLSLLSIGKRNGLVRYRLMPEAERTPLWSKGKSNSRGCLDRLFVRMLGRIISAGCSKVLKPTLRRKALQLRTHWVVFTTLTEWERVWYSFFKKGDSLNRMRKEIG